MIQVTSPGASWQAPAARTGGAAIPISETLPSGNAGSLTTMTEENSGVATLAEGHGVQSEDVVSVCWEDGKRCGMVATVAGNAVTIEGGEGDALPEEDTAVVLTVEIELDVNFDAAKANFVGCASNQRTFVRYVGESTAILGEQIELVPDSVAVEAQFSWLSGQGVECPFAPTPVDPVDKIIVSNGSSIAAANFKAQVIYDPTE
jgi:hypothetical protein